ncbi:MAG: Asp-tRNA(Asn)/Glu-tRNA(Gln) amidotransferase subunit GatA [Spirochaetales bacterium]|nr:Asp-tRNA(Asn)/Glu-tRNA(Gln) amidotransferase subunit GatA [Spirochaetales bacterium]
MVNTERWRALLSRGQELSSWEDWARGVDAKLHSFLQFEPARALDPTRALDGEPRTVDGEPGAVRPLAGTPFGVKDNIAVRSFRLTCGSRLLSSFVSPYTATAVARLQAAGAVPVGKTNLDEFGMGSSTQTSAFGATGNPWDLERVPGGSSGGSAAAVAAGLVPFALGSDTGGSVRQPAAFCGVYGLKPTYGTVSRYGLVAYASSLETIGIIAKELSWIRTVFPVIRGLDPRDHSTVEYRPPAPRQGRLKVGILSFPAAGPAEAGRLSPEVQAGWEKALEALPGLGFELAEVKLPILDYVVSAYYVIACAEASANLARFDGVRYGERAAEADNPEELVRLSRSRGFGEEVKLRILLGTYVLRSGFQDQYYLRAQRIRTAIRQELERVFAAVDLILLPVYPCAAFKRGEEGLDPFTQKLSDLYTCLANLAGLPAMSFPVSVENGLPVGMQFMAPAFAEELLFEACGRYEEHYPAPDSPLYSREWSP